MSAKSAPGKVVACPGCGKPAAYSASNASRPFCSERCRLLDLGAWANESYRISAKADEDEGVKADGKPDE